LFFCFAVILVGCNKNESPKQAFEEYINLWNDREFANMYDHLSEHAQKTISKKEFTEKYQKIYEGIGVKNLKVKTKGENAKDKELFLFEVKMDTDGGKVSFIHEAKLVKDKDVWKIDWTPDFIFPGMKKDYKVRM
ncbi:NTF2-like N-terminal transpeptidase domain-containing protein, partial [Bacillus paramobilis]